MAGGPADGTGDHATEVLLDVGRIGKAHGLRGEVVVDFTTDRVEERTTPGAELLAGERWLVVEAARPHKNKWLITFAGVADRTAAEALRGEVLLAVALEDPEAVFVHELIGKRLVDQHGVDHGPVAAIVENPASDLIELTDGRLVPLAFLVATGDTTVEVSVPAGLLDDEGSEG